MKTPTDSTRLLLFLVAAVVLAAVLWALRHIVILVGFSLLLAYALDPLAAAIERIPISRTRRVPRAVACAIVVLVIAAGAGTGLAFGVPRLISEVERFIAGAPGGLTSLIAQMRDWAGPRGLLPTLAPALDRLDVQGSELLTGLGGMLARKFVTLLGGVGRSLEFLLLPLLAFYLMAERNAVEASALRFVPPEAHDRVVLLSNAVDRALRSYVRGQAVVMLTMGTAVTVLLTLLGFRLALLLGTLAALGELIPYLGFLVAALSVTLAGIAQGPTHALIGLAAYVAANWTVGAFITPRVMGRHLKMHPFVVTVSVLSGVELLGAPGAMLALPTAAVVQSLVAQLTPRETPAGH
ncbi:MAG: AI-2E family transporter [Candidatus Eiseniibacteriota bacterium]